MKIVCDACQAKYSISDDKVQGKVFKIRCKKCSNIIVVRGGAQAAEAAAPAPAEKDTRVYDYGYEGGGAPAGDDAVWHLVINQDQVGPMTAADVQQRFSAGEVDGETFAWKEGMADWLPLSQVDAFASFAGGGGATSEAPSGGGGAAAVSAMFGGGDDTGTTKSDPNDLFASASSSKSSHSEDDDGGDLFGSKPAAAPAAAASAAGNQKLRGERNENSVLFSLNNLAQLASNTPAPAAASSSSSSSGHATGAAGGEGSGLIDIRSMASAYLGGGGAGAAKPATASGAGVGSIDDLPVFGGGGFSEPAVIMPVARQSRDNRILYLMIGAVGLLAIVAVVMVVILLKGGKKDDNKVAAKDDDKSEKSSDKGDKSSDKADKPDDKSDKDDKGDKADKADTKTDDTAKTGGDTGTQVAAAEPKKSDTAAPHTGGAAPAPHTGGAAPAPHTGGGAPAPHTGGAAPAPAPAPGGGAKAPAPAPGGDGGCDEVSCVLNNYDGACCQKFKKAKAGGGSAPKAGGNSNLPDSLDRSMISQGIGTIKGKATACGDRSSAKGVVKVHVKVEGSGHVSSVSVSQTPDPALGACVSAAVQKASFPQTQTGGSFSYPFPF